MSRTVKTWSEDRLQQEAFIWFTNSYPQYRGLLFSVPNGVLMTNEKDEKNWALIKRFKRTGMYSGVSDMIFLFDRTAYLIEFKRPDGGGGQSGDQKKWQETVESQGFKYLLYNNLEDFQSFVTFVINEMPRGQKTFSLWQKRE